MRGDLAGAPSQGGGQALPGALTRLSPGEDSGSAIMVPTSLIPI